MSAKVIDAALKALSRPMGRPCFGEKARAGDSRSPGSKDDWLTPPEIIRGLGEFDLDPASPINRPWPTAKMHFTIIDDGLGQDWDLCGPKGSTRVWLNPPYGGEGPRWVRKAATHGNAIVLVAPRTDAVWFHEVVSVCASLFLFKRRLKFRHRDGSLADNPATPSVLIAFGQNNARALAESGLDGLLFPAPHRSTPEQKPTH